MSAADGPSLSTLVGSARISSADRKRRSEAQLSRTSTHKPWTPQEDALLFDRTIFPFVLAELLGRSTAAISQRRVNLGISSRSAGATRSSEPWTEAENIVIKRRDISLNQMAQMLNRTTAAVQVRRSALGITYRGSGNATNRPQPRADGVPTPVAALLTTQQLRLEFAV